MPFFLFEVETSMSNQQLVEVLKSSTTKLNWVGIPKTSAPFTGIVFENGFRILRIVSGRDSFNPVLFGRFLGSARGIRIRVLMTYHPIVWLLMSAWTAYIGYSFFTSLRINGYTDGLPLEFLFLIAPWAIGIPFFFFDALKSKELFLRVINSTGSPERGGA